MILQGARHDLGRGRREVELDASAEQALSRHTWPGNVRELRNALERALLLSDGNTLRASDFRFDASGNMPATTAIDGRLTLKELEIRYVKQVLVQVCGRVPMAAEHLGIPKSSLYQKLKTYDIDPSEFRISESES